MNRTPGLLRALNCDPPYGWALLAFCAALLLVAATGEAGEARLRSVVRDGGFSKFRRAAQTPFNLIFEARA